MFPPADDPPDLGIPPNRGPLPVRRNPNSKPNPHFRSGHRRKARPQGIRGVRAHRGALSEKKIATIHNVFAVIRGSEEPDRYVLLGNHRDAWTYGAVDPNSGTAGLLDIACRYALMMRQGWQPRRTIVLCSWDAEEFGMVANISSLLVINIKWTRLSISRSFCYF
ncbi:hypothetical protein VitviT2T_019764 [Vitis vinifera]|uniref:Peptidase M28 domain-containing protein n=1 Tax=Vitis vinifera TaxID=29760 RepID=A0ABY9D3J6_VITVI|nr:hypothetical protein VitviT2T_019764 [Vitis vinifera]